MNEPLIVEDKKSPPRCPSRKFSTLMLFILLLFFAAVGGLSYLSFQSVKANQVFAQQVAEIQAKTSTEERAIATLEENVSRLQTAQEKTQSLESQQEQMLLDWRAAQKGDVDKWHAAEAQYLVKLANDDLQFTHHLPLAIALIERANQVLQNLQDSKLAEVKKSLTTSLATLKGLPQIDITGIYLKLDALNTQVDKLALPQNPLTAKPTTETELPADTTWWQAGLNRSWQALQKIVVVKYNGTNALPLVLPEEQTFLYQNLHAQLEGAMWAVLHRNAKIYQANLDRALHWVTTYFDQAAPESQAMIEQIKSLQQINLAPPEVNLTGTLQLFDAYFSQTSTQSSTAQ